MTIFKETRHVFIMTIGPQSRALGSIKRHQKLTSFIVNADSARREGFSPEKLDSICITSLLRVQALRTVLKMMGIVRVTTMLSAFSRAVGWCSITCLD